MKNLKRVLSLALATVMLLGVMVVGANASFTDQDSIKYTAAVDTLVKLGVIQGMENDTFQPNGNLTRAQGARLVALVKAGSNETTVGYYAGTTKFTDVTANHNWAAGSINYCVSLGIISGTTDTTFNPDGPLTGSALAKMMLVALGFSGSTSDSTTTLSGPNWELNAIRMANENGLFDGLDSTFAATRNVTREEACQIMFNALGTDVWEISGKNSNGDYTYTRSTDLIVKCYGATANENATGDYGRPATEYTFSDGRDAIKIAKAPTVTYTGAVTEGKLMADLGLTGTFSDVTGKTELVAKLDGASNDTNVSSLDRTKVNAQTDTVNGTGAGVLTEVYMEKDTTGKTTVTIVSINTYLGKVKTVVKANASTATPAKTTITLSVGDKDFETEAFAKDSMVMVTLDNGVIKTVEAPKTTVATVTAQNTTKHTVTIGGVTYSFNANASTSQAASKAETDFVLSGAYTLYIDNYGNLLGGDVYSAVSNIDVVYVDGASVVATQDGIEGVSATVRVRVNYMDGTSEVLPIEVKTATATTGHSLAAGDKYITIETSTAGTYDYKKLDTTTASTVEAALKGKLFSYVKKDGNIQLSEVLTTTGTPATTAALTANGSALTLKKGDAAVGSNYASTTTKVTLVKDGSVVTYTGYNNFPANATYTVGTDNVSAIVTITTGNIVSDILILGGAPTANATPDVYAYYIGTGDKTSDGQYHDFYVNGVVKSYLIADGVTVPTQNQAVGLFLDSKNVVTNTAAGQASAKVVTVGDGFVVIGSDVYYTTSTAAVYNVATAGACTADTMAKDDEVTFVYHNDPVSGLKILDAAFITKEA